MIFLWLPEALEANSWVEESEGVGEWQQQAGSVTQTWLFPPQSRPEATSQLASKLDYEMLRGEQCQCFAALQRWPAAVQISGRGLGSLNRPPYWNRPTVCSSMWSSSTSQSLTWTTTHILLIKFLQGAHQHKTWQVKYLQFTADNLQCFCYQGHSVFFNWFITSFNAMTDLTASNRSITGCYEDWFDTVNDTFESIFLRLCGCQDVFACEWGRGESESVSIMIFSSSLLCTSVHGRMQERDWSVW